MKLTNKYGLPGAIFQAVKGFQGEYIAGKKKADISVTQLIGPPQIVTLTKAHKDELEEDVSDRIWALMGSAMHSLLERAEPSSIVEERLYGEYNGWIVSGQFDRLTNSQKTLQDYKFCSVWEHINGVKPDRVNQLNVLAQLAIENGYPVTGLEIVAIYRDWSKSKANFDSSYPQSQVQRIKVPMWDEETRLAYINERVRLHRLSQAGTQIDCTDEERWNSGNKYAVMKGKNKRAVKLYDSKEQALIHAGKDDQFWVQDRPGINRRCEDYCAVKPFCKQYQSLMENTNG